MNKKNYKYFFVFIIFLICAIILPNPPKSYSKYQSIIASNNSNVKIASFVFLSSIDASLPLELNQSLYPGTSIEFYFTVQNYNAAITSEITLNYTLNITKTDNLPINIEIYRNDELIDYSKTNNFILAKNTKVLDVYKIKISWDVIDNEYTYANTSDEISIQLVATQID